MNELKHKDIGPPEAMREQPEVLKEGLQELLDLLRRRTANAAGVGLDPAAPTRRHDSVAEVLGYDL